LSIDSDWQTVYYAL